MRQLNNDPEGGITALQTRRGPAGAFSDRHCRGRSEFLVPGDHPDQARRT